jgi:hypothetical protein
MSKWTVCGLLLQLLLFSCATTNKRDVQPPPPPPISVPPAPSVYNEILGPVIDEIDYFATAAVQTPSDRAGKYTAVAYVLLPHGIARDRAVGMCKALFTNLPSNDRVAIRAIPDSKRIPTFWPATAGTSRSADFEDLVNRYDQDSADAMLTVAKVTGRPGPILVAWQGPGNSFAGETLVLDLSDVPTDDFTSAVLLWQRHVAVDPAAWNGAGWAIDKVRLQFNTFAQKYGDSIVSSVKTVWDLFAKK